MEVVRPSKGSKCLGLKIKWVCLVLHIKLEGSEHCEEADLISKKLNLLIITGTLFSRFILLTHGYSDANVRISR